MSANKLLVQQTRHLIESWIDYQTYVKEVPGIAVGIFVEDEIVLQREYGYADLEARTKLTDRHLFRIASHSKLFTATAIMKLYHEDRLSLDDRIGKQLPWFASERDENVGNIRIQHLLTHSSGMTRDGETGHWIKLEFPEKEEIVSMVQEGISFYGTSEHLKYSNVGYTILGQVIEAVSGQSYEEYIQENILEPLEMHDTVVDITPENEARHFKGYTRRLPGQAREPIPHVATRVMHSATGFSSTAGDLIKFYRAHMFGNDVLFPDHIKREMQRTQFKGKGAEWGLGFTTVEVDKVKMVGHGGGYPGFITFSGLVQDQKLVLVILTNAIDGPPRTLFEGIAAIFGHVAKKAQDFMPKPGDDAELPDFSDVVGFYASHWGTSLFSQIGTRLISIEPGLDAPLESFQIYQHKEGRTFVPGPDLGMASPGQPISFIDGQDGEKMIEAAGARVARFKFSY